MSLQVPGGWTLSNDQLLQQRRWSKANNHAACFFQIWEEGELYIMTVTDLFDSDFPTVSVTNDAEFVTMSAWNNARTHGLFPDTPIIYKDTEGWWDESRHREGHFATFRSLNTRDLEEALSFVKAFHERDKQLYNER